MGGAMTWVSERNLVAAISNAGGFGVIASGSMSPDLLDEEIAATAALTDRPFGVNLITMHPQLARADRCLPRAARSAMSCSPAASLPARRSRASGTAAPGRCASPRRWSSPRSWCAWAPTRSSSRAARRAAISARFRPRCWRRRSCRMSARCRCSSPAASAAARRSCPISKWARPACSSARALSAPTNRSRIRNFKRAFIRASARDAVPSVQLDTRFPVIPVRALANPATERFAAMQREVIDRFSRGELSQKDAQLEIEHFWAGALRRAVIDGDVEGGSLMAGQSVGLVTREQSTVEILDELVDQALAVIASAARDRRRIATDAAAGRDRADERGHRTPASCRAGPVAAAGPDGAAAPRPAACCAGCATSWPGRAARRSGSTGSSASSPPRWSPRSARPMSCAPARCSSCSPPRGCGREAVHRTRLRVGEGLVGVIAATRAAAGAGRRAVASRFRLSAGDRRGDLPLADGRADPARRPRARRAGGAEPHAAPLHRGRDRDRCRRSR